MRRLPLTLPAVALGATGILLLSTAPAYAADDDVYTITGADLTPGPAEWHFSSADPSADPSAVLATAIGSTPMPYYATIDGVEIVDGVGYLLTRDPALITWDPVTGEVIGEPTSITGASVCYGLTTTSTGELLTGCEGIGDGIWGVGTLDVDTGAFDPIVTLGDHYASGSALATNPLTAAVYGFVYSLEAPELVVIRLDLGEETFEELGAPPFSVIWSADFDSEGTLWAHAFLDGQEGLIEVGDVGDTVGDWAVRAVRTYELGDADIQTDALALGDGIVDPTGPTVPDVPDDPELAETGPEFGGVYWAMSIGGIAMLIGAAGLAIARVRIARRG